MTLAPLFQKARRLPAVARDGWRYPALRLQANTAEPAVDVLAALGLARDELLVFEREFAELAPQVFERLAEAGRAAGDDEAASRAARPSSSSVEGKRLMYLAARAVRPKLAVETGPFNGAGTTFLLHALAANREGRLLSFDLQDARDALGVPLAAGKEPAWMVPDELRDRLELILGDTRETLRSRLAGGVPIELFVHDSLHTTRHMLFEFRIAWRHLRPGGVLISDDAFWNPAFWLFTKHHRVPFRHIGTMGVTRKRA